MGIAAILGNRGSGARLRWFPAPSSLLLVVSGLLPGLHGTGGQAWAQLPPGAHIYVIDLDMFHCFPAINDGRQIAFQAGMLEPIAVNVYLHDDGDTTVISNTEWFNWNPDINNDGIVTWQQGVSAGDFDPVVYNAGEITVIDASPLPDGHIVVNDAGQLAWRRWTCWPAPDNCKEIFRYTDGESVQVSFGSPLRRSTVPQINHRGDVVWLERDWTFGLFNGSAQIKRFADGVVTQLSTGEQHIGQPHQNDVGQVVWFDELPAPIGPSYLWEDGTTKELVAFGAAVAINNRADVLIGASTGVGFFLRNGVFYQPFAGLPQVGADPDMNNRGDVVATGVGDADDAVFVMLIDAIRGDFDEDGDVDVDDAVGLASCLTGPVPTASDPACDAMDMDADADVDLRDVAAVQRAWTGACAIGITTPPNGQGVCVLDEAQWSIEARGPVATYQWRFEGQDIPGATEPTYTFQAFGGSEGLYGVRLTSACGWEVESDRRFILEVQSSEPDITDQPQDRTACVGQDVRFCTFADAYDFVYFQWEKDGVAIDGADWWCLILRDVDAADAGAYRCRVSNACGEVVSNPATLTVAAPDGVPFVMGAPVPGTVGQGHQYIFNVTAWCAEAYQWHLDGVDVPGATTDQLVIPAATCADAGAYTVTVANGLGAVTTAAATLTVTGCR